MTLAAERRLPLSRWDGIASNRKLAGCAAQKHRRGPIRMHVLLHSPLVDQYLATLSAMSGGHAVQALVPATNRTNTDSIDVEAARTSQRAVQRRTGHRSACPTIYHVAVRLTSQRVTTASARGGGQLSRPAEHCCRQFGGLTSKRTAWLGTKRGKEHSSPPRTNTLTNTLQDRLSSRAVRVSYATVGENGLYLWLSTSSAASSTLRTHSLRT
jgi:hypothetical protein